MSPLALAHLVLNDSGVQPQWILRLLILALLRHSCSGPGGPPLILAAGVYRGECLNPRLRVECNYLGHQQNTSCLRDGNWTPARNCG